MRVLSGTASGIVLNVPRGLEVRPTGVRARGALFDSVSSTIGWTGACVVDLFAGSGALGIEAASRGAETVRFVEKSPKHAAVIRKNLEKIAKAGVTAELEVVVADALSVHKRLPALSGTVDFVFADPPYADFDFAWRRLLADAGFAEWASKALMVWETPPDAKPSPPDGWSIVKREFRGGTAFIHARVK
ncbi:MAG: hypothetical protein GXP32_00315 [Kiritimatiellaeota bacterium]|nr:hypothetical protein [Kiritimatiellota bacterium]